MNDRRRPQRRDIGRGPLVVPRPAPFLSIGKRLEATGRDGDYILGTAIGEFIVAALLFLVASAIMSGAKWARLVTAIVVGLNIAVVSWWMITHFGGGLQWRALITVGLGIFVLWALYGNDQSEAYFEGHP